MSFSILEQQFSVVICSIILKTATMQEFIAETESISQGSRILAESNSLLKICYNLSSRIIAKGTIYAEQSKKNDLPEHDSVITTPNRIFIGLR